MKVIPLAAESLGHVAGQRLQICHIDLGAGLQQHLQPVGGGNVAAGHQAVGVEHDLVAGRQSDLAAGVADLRHRPDRHPDRAAERLPGAVRGVPDRTGLTRRGPAQPPQAGLVVGDQQGSEPIRIQLAEHPVQRLQQLHRGHPEHGVGAHGAA